MDAPLTLEGLDELVNFLITDGDYEGAEEILYSALGTMPENEKHIHFHFGKIYAKWNKLSSAMNHLGKALELSAGDEQFITQVEREIKRVKVLQLGQKP
jgi:hypothetical protein